MSRQEQKPDFWVPSLKKVRAEKIQIFSDLKKIYSSLQIRKIEIFYDPQKISKPCDLPFADINGFHHIAESKEEIHPILKVYLGQNFSCGPNVGFLLLATHIYNIRTIIFPITHDVDVN